MFPLKPETCCRTNAEVRALFPGEKKPKYKTFNADPIRIFGITPFYKKQGLNAGDMLLVDNMQDCDALQMEFNKMNYLIL